MLEVKNKMLDPTVKLELQKYTKFDHKRIVNPIWNIIGLFWAEIYREIKKEVDFDNIEI